MELVITNATTMEVFRGVVDVGTAADFIDGVMVGLGFGALAWLVVKITRLFGTTLDA